MSLHELFDILFRWVHLIAGIMWIGNSMLFNWLDRNLVRPPGSDERKGFEGEIWMVHSGAFYQVEKKLLEPNQMPAQLHWFKWQNGVTWLSGISLLILVYYMNDGAFLIDPAVADISARTATAISVGTLIGAWVIYDLLWRVLEKQERIASVISIALLGAIAFAATQLLSGRAAFLHVGVMMGTLMTGNVWMRIMPSQRQLIAATKAGEVQDKALSLRAKQRSIHNNYMTFPLLFIMLSNHFPSTFGSHINWAILFVVLVGSAGVRHFMNIRFVYKGWLVPAAILLVATLGGMYALASIREHRDQVTIDRQVAFSEVLTIIQDRCVTCHSKGPTDEVFQVAPSGVLFDSPAQIKTMAGRIRERVVVTRTMPFINKTAMTEQERAVLGAWVDQGAALE